VQTTDDNGGVHINSGIPNRAFVLAAKAIGGRSWEVTGRIWYVTLTERLTASADFEKCARETVSVARDLYPNDPSIAGKIAQAWVDVGVLQPADTMVPSVAAVGAPTGAPAAVALHAESTAGRTKKTTARKRQAKGDGLLAVAAPKARGREHRPA
jgi:hypothetical protein